MGWVGHFWRKQLGLGYGCSGCAFAASSAFFALAAFAGWVRKGSCLTAWAVPPLSSCSCSYLYGRGTAVGPQSGERCWPLLDTLWRAITPLMKPWCAEGDVPTAANLNLYRGWSSYVGRHSDDEPLFGECGGAKLIVSVSLGSSALFRWRSQSRPDDDGHSCLLGHGDIHARMSSVIVRIPVRIRNGLTSRSVGSNSMLPPVPFLGQEWHVVCQRGRAVFLFLVRSWWGKVVFWLFGFSLVPCASWGY